MAGITVGKGQVGANAASSNTNAGSSSVGLPQQINLYGTDAAFTDKNPVIPVGSFAIVEQSDGTVKLKAGNGIKNYREIPFFGSTGVSSYFRGKYLTLAALQVAVSSGQDGDFALVDAGVGSDAALYIWDVSDASWRPSGSLSAFTTDNLAEGATRKYFSMPLVWATVLTGLSAATIAVVSATDTVLGAIGKLQAQITANKMFKATQAEARAGFDDLKYMSPKNVADAIISQSPVLASSHKGVANPGDNPGVQTVGVWWIANGPGTYANFGGVVITGQLGLISWTPANGFVASSITIDISAAITALLTIMAGKNKYDPSKLNVNHALGSGDASTQYYLTGAISDFIPVDEAKQYTLSGRDTGSPLLKPFAFYDVNKTLIGSVLDKFNFTFTPIAGAKFCNFTVKADASQNDTLVMLEESAFATDYEAYSPVTTKIGNYTIQDASTLSLVSKLPTFTIGENLFNPANVQIDKALQYQNGQIQAYPTGKISDFIPVDDTLPYYLFGRADQNITAGIAFFKADFTPLSALDMSTHPRELGFYPATGAKYIVFGCAGDAYQDMSKIMFAQSLGRPKFKAYGNYVSKVAGKPIADLEARANIDAIIKRNLKGVVLIAWGDSQTYGAGASIAAIFSWVARLANKRGWTFVNHGHPGQNTSQFIAGSTFSDEPMTAIEDYLTVTISTDARFVCSFCTNDVNTLDEATYEANLKIIWEHTLFTKNWPAKKCFNISGFYVNNNIDQAKYARFASIQHRVALSFGVESYNMRPYIIKGNGVLSGDQLMDLDLIHNNNAGYELIANVLDNLIAA